MKMRMAISCISSIGKTIQTICRMFINCKEGISTRTPTRLILRECLKVCLIILQNIEPDNYQDDFDWLYLVVLVDLADHALFANKAAWHGNAVLGKDMWKSRICLVEGDPKDAVYSAPTNSEDIPHLKDLARLLYEQVLRRMTQLTPVFETRTDSESKEASLLRWESQTIKYAVVHEAYATIKGISFERYCSGRNGQS